MSTSILLTCCMTTDHTHSRCREQLDMLVSVSGLFSQNENVYNDYKDMWIDWISCCMSDIRMNVHFDFGEWVNEHVDFVLD